MKYLGVLLCYNDADILEDCIIHLLENNHDLIIWDHGSDDGTKNVLDRFNNLIMERKYIPREFDFYSLYPEMSKNLIENYTKQYDWISWPDQDEILEGQDRSAKYSTWLDMIYENGYDFIRFNNFNFWFTAADDQSLDSPAKRIRHYSLFPDCAPRIRSWRADKTNIRIFNHNPVDGTQAPVNFNLRHYPMRSQSQMLRRLTKDRINLQRDGNNYHYENMNTNLEKLTISPDLLHYDNGSELNFDVKYNWRNIYGYSAMTK